MGKRPPLDAPVDEDAATRVYDSGPVTQIPASGPIQVISAKTPGTAPAPAPAPGPQPTPELVRPKLRAISDVTPLPSAQPASLGYLAPPRDPATDRVRRRRDLVLWSSAAIAVAAVVAAAIWFAAR